jgi:flagellar motor protein MotB
MRSDRSVRRRRFVTGAVVGHSDSQLIRSFRYQNNFELSSIALAVLHRLE